jgi:hypothetical protein
MIYIPTLRQISLWVERVRVTQSSLIITYILAGQKEYLSLKADSAGSKIIE